MSIFTILFKEYIYSMDSNNNSEIMKKKIEELSELNISYGKTLLLKE